MSALHHVAVGKGPSKQTKVNKQRAKRKRMRPRRKQRLPYATRTIRGSSLGGMMKTTRYVG